MWPPPSAAKCQWKPCMQPIGRKSRHPFDGKPATQETTDESGNPEFLVSARVLTPLRAKIADRLGEATAYAGTLACILYAQDHDPPGIPLICAGACWFLRPLFESGWREGLKRRVQVAVTGEQFRFRRWLGWISFDRALQHRFGLVIHDLA